MIALATKSVASYRVDLELKIGMGKLKFWNLLSLAYLFALFV